MLSLHIRPAAAVDIDEIVDYLAAENILASQGFVSDLQRCFDLVAENPEIGIRRQYRSKSLNSMRMFPLKKYSSYLVFYLADDLTIDIVRVLHGRRDIEMLFNDDR